MKIALVVDWLTVYSGAERVVEQILNIYPNADIFALVDFLPTERRFFIKDKVVTTSFLQRMPMARTKYRNYLALMPIAIEQLDVSGYDIVLSSSHAVAKGVITGPNQLHICYIHSPIRYAWDLQHQYLRETGLNYGLKGVIARCILHYIRTFDVRSSFGVDYFVANSQYIARRVKKFYGRDSFVIYPPVSTDDFSLQTAKQDYFVTTSRLVPYKRVDLIAKTFKSLPDRSLIIIGDGPEYSKISEIVKGCSNITLKGYLEFEEVVEYMKNAKAFVFAAEEDFGISPVEAMACGTPVIAFGKGGALETVVDKKTGIFFYEQDIESLTRAIYEFDTLQTTFSPELIRQHAVSFSKDAFKFKFKELVSALIDKSKLFNRRDI